MFLRGNVMAFHPNDLDLTWMDAPSDKFHGPVQVLAHNKSQTLIKDVTVKWARKSRDIIIDEGTIHVGEMEAGVKKQKTSGSARRGTMSMDRKWLRWLRKRLV
jgi:hypothetical protein